MARLSTEPAKRKVVQLRSRFVALPVDSKDFLFARTHEQDADSSSSSSPVHQLFVTGLQLGTTSSSLKKAFSPFGKVTSVSLILPPPSSTTTLSIQQIAQSQSLDSPILPLLSPLPSQHPISAILSFATAPNFPPTTKSITPLISSRPTLPSFLESSANKYDARRPHLSTIIAHSDSWMNQYDKRQAALIPDSYTPNLKPSASAKASKLSSRNKKGGKDVGPLPGSAAAALATYSAAQAALLDRSTNPDEVPEGEWTLVSRGGKHGQSLLPTGAVPSLLGYGGVTVGVARKGGKRRMHREEDAEEEGEQGIKKIVGDGFYRFTKEDGRRKDLENLKARFEEDKERVGRFRESRGRGGSSRGGSSSRGGASRGRGGGGASRGRGGSSGGRDSRSYKPY
ncbi:hypothetical protein P7C70_g529, partial [Phenoliferia sp. Uapishka_3]